MKELEKRDFLRLLAVAKKTSMRDWLMILLHFWHAARNSEIIHLTRDNFVGTRIKFARGKGSNPCDQQLVEHRNPLLNEREAVFAYVRTLAPKQRLFPMSRWTYRRLFLRHCAAAKIDAGVLQHNATRALKHSLCTYMYENAPANKVQRRAGHKNGANTLRYGEMTEKQAELVVERAVGL